MKVAWSALIVEPLSAQDVQKGNILVWKTIIIQSPMVNAKIRI